MDRRKEYAEEEENLAAKSAAFVQYLTRRGYLITKQVSSDEAAIRRQEFAKKAYHNIKSHYVIVTYNNANSEDIITALNSGRATIADLDEFDIEYTKKPKS